MVGLIGLSAALGAGGITAIRLISINRSGSDIAVTFEAVQGATYRLERKVQMGEATWQSIPGLNDLTAGATAPAQLVDSGALNLDRAFYRVSYVPTLTLTKPGTGSGTVTSSPAGINCGTDCAENFSRAHTSASLRRQARDRPSAAGAAIAPAAVIAASRSMLRSLFPPISPSWIPIHPAPATSSSGT